MVFDITARIRRTTLTKVAGLLVLVAVVVLGLGSRTSADTIDVGPFVATAGADVARSTIMVERLSDGQIWVSNPARATQRFSPASTSKIPHTLIALEQGLATPETVFAWDGAPKGLRAWNQDHSLETAFKKSVVWVYQEIARTAGHDTMSRALADFGYGNMNVGPKDQLTTYWLNDTLQISAAEQVAFLSKLAREQLSVSASTYAAAMRIMISDARGTWVMRSKTGWRYSEGDMDIGWFVGWLECADETYVFAVNIDMPDTRSLPKRKDIAYSVLEGIQAFDCD
ncbi:MAG: penicillin-binding transpeptidase domain-containing protein [Pseudomonadota bacterium]